MIRKATILVPCPTWSQQEATTPAQHSPQMEKRFFQHIWSTLSSKIEKVPMLFHYLLFFKQGLLVAGGFNGGQLSSTEIYLPSNNKWTAVKNLPRFHFAKAPLYFIKNCFYCLFSVNCCREKVFPGGWLTLELLAWAGKWLWPVEWFMGTTSEMRYCLKCFYWSYFCPRSCNTAPQRTTGFR